MSLSSAPDTTDATAAAARTTVRWRIFAIIFVLVVVNMMDRTTLSIAMPTISRDFALSPAMQGVILSAFFWTYALLQVPGGWLIDRFGPRALISCSTILWGLFQAVAGLSVGGVSLLFARLGLGASEAPLFPAGSKLNALWMSPQERSRGAVLMDSGSSLGAGFGGIIIAFLIIVLHSWRLAFLAAGLATLALGLAAWRYLRDDPAAHPGVSKSELAWIRGSSSVAAAVIAAPRRIAARSMSGLLIGRLCWAMINFGLMTWGPSYLAEARGFDLKQMGYATFVIFLCGMVGSLFAGFVGDMLISRGLARGLVVKSMVGLSGTAVCASFIVLPYVRSPEAAVAVLSGTLFFLYWGSLYWSLPGVLAPQDKVGLLGGVMNFAGSVGGITVPIVTGLILQYSGGYLAALFYFAGCAALYVAATLFIAFPSIREARGG